MRPEPERHEGETIAGGETTADGETIDGDETISAADDLVRRAQAGDAEAFGCLYHELVPRVYRFCLYRVGRPSDAEDLTQLTFLKVVEALPRYERRGYPFAAWVFRLARNAVIDFERAKREHTPLDAISGAIYQRDADMVDSVGDRATLETALKTLTPEQRDVLVYRFFGGLSSRETGALMGKRETAIRTLQFRALAALRRTMTADEVVPVLQAGPSEP